MYGCHVSGVVGLGLVIYVGGGQSQKNPIGRKVLRVTVKSTLSINQVIVRKFSILSEHFGII